MVMQKMWMGITNMIECKTWNCPCGNGYDNSVSLEYHLRKEHTKGELVHYLKMEARSKLA